MGLFVNKARRLCDRLSMVGLKKSSDIRFKPAFMVGAVLLLLVVPFSSAFALGMGAAMPDSYIGERLSIHIPIFNVKKPDSLEVLLQRSENDSGVVPLDAFIERKNAQLGVRITSEAKTGEPYISFVIEIIDDGDVTSKEFTVLLDLASNNPSSASVDRASTRDAFESSYELSNTTSVVRSNKIMGPYDWAQAGQVAESFGPVLDGQSLWRVARRINKALGVSVDQMMWSLYQNNRNQFSNGSISSLKAGAFLKIPTAQQASQISEQEAKSKIIKFRDLQGSTALQNEAVSLEGKGSEGRDAVAVTNVDEQSFQLTSLDSSDNENGQSSLPVDSQSQDVIASLAEAVGNLTQELIKKDQKISFLEEKVAALEEYAKISASDLPKPQVESAGIIGVEIDGADAKVVLNNVSQPSIEVEAKEIDGGLNASTIKESAFKFKPWYWFVIISAVFFIVVFLFRRHFIELFSSLNLFRDEEKIEFDPSEYHQADSQFSMPSHDVDDSELTVENVNNLNGLSQKSILDAIKTAVQVEDPLSPQTLMDLDGEFSYTEMLSENGSSLNSSDASLSFIERFNSAMAKHDYDFALQLLNMAKGNEIDQESYHYHRLRMYEAMHDEDAFYDYFCEVENEIPSFNPEMQTKISQLVLQMAQQ